MINTPPLPRWIRDYRIEGYTNVYELLPDEEKLFGTETLFGDWHGRLLLLAQDFAPDCYVKKRIKTNQMTPYHHKLSCQTNTRLTGYLRDSGLTEGDRSGILYGSALGPLMRNDDNWRGPLPSRHDALAFGSKIVDFTVSQMPNLAVVMCLGTKAWECGVNAFSASDAFTLNKSDQFGWCGEVALVKAHHPMASKTKSDQFKNYQFARKLIRDKLMNTPRGR